MLNNDLPLPVHPTTGLTALGWTSRGPIWPILGGDGTGDGNTGDSGNGDGQGDTADGDGAQQQDTAQDVDTQDDADPDGADALGDPGKRALDAMKARLKRERDRRRQYEAELDALRKGAAKDETDTDVIRQEAERAATAKANARIVRAEVRAAAAGRLADPADALQFLDLSQFEVDDDGNVDTDEITDAIADLLQRKPYLAAQTQPPKRFQGGADGGQGRGAKPKDLDTQIREAEAKGDVQAAIALKQRKLAEASKKTR